MLQLLTAARIPATYLHDHHASVCSVQRTLEGVVRLPRTRHLHRHYLSSSCPLLRKATRKRQHPAVHPSESASSSSVPCSTRSTTTERCPWRAACIKYVHFYVHSCNLYPLGCPSWAFLQAIIVNCPSSHETLPLAWMSSRLC
jgi:hypothetical protein